MLQTPQARCRYQVLHRPRSSSTDKLGVMWLSVNVRRLTVADLTEFEILASLYIRQCYCCLHDRPPDKLAQAGRAHLETGHGMTETQHQTDDHADKSNVDRQT